VHVAFFAERARLSPEEVASTCEEADAGAFSPRERLLLRLVDELHDTAQVSDTLWQALAAEWTAEQLIELIALAGFYHLISFMTNALRIPKEAFGACFPAG
jgi:alkylhydroperoxidase family enzyme